MKELLLKCCLFLLGLVFTLFLFAIPLPKILADYYLASIKHKELRLQDSSGERIIIIGGSNILFGIDSKLIETTFGRPVVNMGLHAGLNYHFLLNQINNYVQKGDMLIVIPEHTNYFNPCRISEASLQTITIQPKSLFYFQKYYWYELGLKSLIYRVKKNIESFQLPSSWFLPKNNLYSVNGINEYGDQINHLNKKLKRPLRGTPIVFSSCNFDDCFLDKTADLVKFTKKEDIDLFFSFPSTAASFYDEQFGTCFSEKLQELDIKLLGSEEAFVYPDTYFFDTMYHLNKEGRTTRTTQLIELLTPHIRKVAQ